MQTVHSSSNQLIINVMWFVHVLEEGSETNEPLLEMCVSCDGLPCETNGQQPNTFVSVAVLTPPEQDWSAHAHTEIIEVGRWQVTWTIQVDACIGGQ